MFEVYTPQRRGRRSPPPKSNWESLPLLKGVFCRQKHKMVTLGMCVGCPHYQGRTVNRVRCEKESEAI
jgi:hypothetical protein